MECLINSLKNLIAYFNRKQKDLKGGKFDH